jgi:hypothetical protein
MVVKLLHKQVVSLDFFVDCLLQTCGFALANKLNSNLGVKKSIIPKL